MTPRRSIWRLHVALAAALYLVVALWAFRAILPRPSVAMPYSASVTNLSWLKISWGDQCLTAALITQNARRFMTAPWKLFDNGQCYPTPSSAALGEHMFGVGLRGVIPYALTRDPVLTTNIVSLAIVWTAGMAMYVLVAYWTRSPWAALIAGLLFAFQPDRLNNILHPYVEANDWTVLALLAAHRLFVRGRWLDAALLAGALGLQMLESFYLVLGLAVLGGSYGLYLVLRFWRRLPALAPKLLAVVGGVTLIAAAVFLPYLHVQKTWSGAIGGRTPLLLVVQEFGPGHAAYPGTVAAVLAIIALLDRVRRRRDNGHGYDPRLPLLVAGLLVVWGAVAFVPLPFGMRLPSLYILASQVIPGLDAVRVGNAIRRAATVVVMFLAGYGVLVVLEHRAPRTRALLAIAIVVAVLANLFVPPFARHDFGAPTTLVAHDFRPPDEVVALYDRLPPGPVLDLPFAFDSDAFLNFMPHYAFMAAYHHRPVGACYNSFIVQVQRDLETIASGVPDPRSVDALAALGFRSIVVHDEFVMIRRDKRFWGLSSRAIANHPVDAEATHLTTLGTAPTHVAYVLDHAVTPTTSFAVFATGDPVTGLTTAKSGAFELRFILRNGSEQPFRHPSPIEPTWLLVRWHTATGEMVREDRVRALLPLALGAGQTMIRAVTLPAFVVPGKYQLTLTTAAAPDLVLSRQGVYIPAPS